MGDDFIGARKILGSELKLDLGRCEAGKKRNMKWNGTPGLLYGLSLCCNVEVRFVRETFMNSAGYRPQRARQSAGLKKRKCSALVESHELLREIWQA